MPQTTWILVTIVSVSLAIGCRMSPTRKGDPIDPPIARIEPHPLETHGHVRLDNYYWLNQRDNPEVIRYLKSENEFAKSQMSHAEQLVEKLFKEMVGRIEPDDTSVPVKIEDYFYYKRNEKGKEYGLHCRRKNSMDSPEQIMLDGNALAKGHEYFALRGNRVSSGQDILAYATDTVGRRVYTIEFRNLSTGKALSDKIPGATGNMEWANDNRTLFYAKQDPVTLRPDRIYRHRLGTDPSRDVLVYEEKDETFGASIQKTKSKRYLVIGSHQTESSEARFLDANEPNGEFRVFLPRERKHEYSIEHFGGHFYIRTNRGAPNFRLMKTPVDRTSFESWEEVIPHRDEVLLEEFEVFGNHLVIVEREGGLVRLRVRDWPGQSEHYLDFGEPAYSAYVTMNPEVDTSTLRYSYSSMTTPNSVYDYDMDTRAKVLKKRDKVLGGFDPDDYRTERLHAIARDGTKVPISLVYRKELASKKPLPLLLYGYGSYGASMDANFRPSRLSLLDRGFIYAIAHVRGGEELGRAWYEQGKLLNKKNTFSDFIDCGEFLIEAGYADPEKLFAMGGSAGGLLVGSVINMRPDLFRGVVAAVPFVDVVTTMLDESIPLTTSEYDEWGNPNEKKYYDYILSYSPYDNVEAKDYPHILVTTGLHDSQVQYWEPAKWVARLRAVKTDSNRLLLKTNMEAGHGGASGRFRRFRETAFEYGFLLDLAGVRR